MTDVEIDGNLTKLNISDTNSFLETFKASHTNLTTFSGYNLTSLKSLYLLDTQLSEFTDNTFNLLYHLEL